VVRFPDSVLRVGSQPIADTLESLFILVLSTFDLLESGLVDALNKPVLLTSQVFGNPEDFVEAPDHRTMIHVARNSRQD